MFLKLFFTIILIKQGHLWSIGNLCPAETQHRYFNRNHGLIQLYCNSKGNYSQINEILDLNELELTELEELEHFYDDGFTITVQVEKKILTKVITKYNETRSQINIPEELEEITFFNNQIDHIENDFFSGLSILYKLRLNQNNLRGVEPFSFKDLESLILLELMSNKLTKIENNTFIGLSYFEGKLLLESNDISILEFDANYSPAGGPYDFDFSHNNLTIFPKWEMGGWAGHRFDLSHNQISYIEPLSFSIYVEYINLEYNRIISLNDYQSDGIWTGVGRINILKLSHNYLVQIPSIESDSLRLFYLDHNNLTNLKIFNTKNEQIEFLKFRTTYLVLLSLDFNQIKSIENKTFQHLRKLENLSMSYNHLTRINRIDFYYQYQLKFLNLSQNRIIFIEFDAFENLNNLLILDLSSNNLTLIENGQFKGLVYLTSLYLNNNNKYLKRLKIHSFDFLLNIRNIHLDELVVIENECILISFKNEFKAERNIENKYSFYRSLNLISPLFAFDKNQTFFCDFIFRLLQFKIHFNLKSDYDNELFYEKCKIFLIKKSNYFSNSKKDCLNEMQEYGIENGDNINEESIAAKVLSNFYYWGTMLALSLLLVPGFIYICMDLLWKTK